MIAATIAFALSFAILAYLTVSLAWLAGIGRANFSSPFAHKEERGTQLIILGCASILVGLWIMLFKYMPFVEIVMAIGQ